MQREAAQKLQSGAKKSQSGEAFSNYKVGQNNCKVGQLKNYKVGQKNHKVGHNTCMNSYFSSATSNNTIKVITVTTTTELYFTCNGNPIKYRF